MVNLIKGKKYKIVFDILNKDTLLTVIVKEINGDFITFEDKYGVELGYREDTIKSIREIKNE